MGNSCNSPEKAIQHAQTMNMLNVAMLLLLVSLYVARVDGRFTTRFLGEQRQEHQHQHSFQGMFVPPFHQRIATSDRHQGDDEHDQSSEQSQLRFTAIERGNGNSSDFEGMIIHYIQLIIYSYFY